MLFAFKIFIFLAYVLGNNQNFESMDYEQDHQFATPLHNAIRQHSSMEIVNELIKHGVSINAPDINGDRPLHISVYNSTPMLIKQLLDHGASVNQRNSKGETPLHIAIEENVSLKIVRELLIHGAEVDAKNKFGNTPLHQAFWYGSRRKLKLIRLLLDHAASVTEISGNCDTPLHVAIERKMNFKVIRELLKRGAEVDAPNLDGDTPIYKYLKFGSVTNLKLLRELLSHGASVNGSNVEGKTPLHIAIQRMSSEVIEELLKSGADVNCKNSCGEETPLYNIFRFRSRSSLEILKKLLCYGASVNERNEGNETPLHVAIQRKMGLEVIREILRHGADINIRDVAGETALFEAIGYESSKRSELIKELLILGASVCERNESGDTPLHAAVREGVEVEVVQELIKHGAGVNEKDMGGQTPLYCRYWWNLETTRELLKSGASVHINCSQTNCLVMPGLQKSQCADVHYELLKYSLVEDCTDKSCFFCNDLIKIFETPMSEFSHEIEKMKTQHINDVSLYECVVQKQDYGKVFEEGHDILSEFSAFSRRLGTEYPKYQEIILNALETREYLLKKICNISVFVKTDQVNKKVLHLNAYCLRAILKYLSKGDLKNFMKACCN